MPRERADAVIASELERRSRTVSLRDVFLPKCVDIKFGKDMHSYRLVAYVTFVAGSIANAGTLDAHSNTEHEGHYYAYLLCETGEWWLLDDNNKNVVTEEEALVRSGQHVTSFWERVDSVPDEQSEQAEK